jgi:hypothetical protein
VTRRFNPPPGWPRPPEGWLPTPGWRPDPAWPPAPPNWPFYVETQSPPTDFIPPPSDFNLLIDPSGRLGTRPWYRRKRYLVSAGVIVLLILGGILAERAPDTIRLIDGGQPASSSPVPAGTTPAATRSPGPTATPSARSTPAAVAPPAAARPSSARPVVAKPKPKPKKKPKKSAATCDANYSQACVPIAGDVDCAGGSGNGPAYFSGIAKVIGSDIYDLDRDGDGYACEPS